MKIKLNELELDDVGVWPTAVKIFCAVALTIFLIAIGLWIDTRRQNESLEAAQREEEDLRKTFEIKQGKVTNLEAYKEQLVIMKASFGALLRQLPEKTEVPGLLEDISHQGLAAGLEFKTIRLLPEQENEFYLELPIEISVVGNYHQLAEFVSNVAALPRIVTLHDFTIRPLKNNLAGDRLQMDITAKTYRYSADEDENAKQ